MSSIGTSVDLSIEPPLSSIGGPLLSIECPLSSILFPLISSNTGGRPLFFIEGIRDGGNSSIALEGMEAVVERVVATVPNLETVLRWNGWLIIRIPQGDVVFQEVELSAIMKELKYIARINNAKEHIIF